MPGQHVHDGGLPVPCIPAARSHFIKVKADYLGIAQIKLSGIFQNCVGVNGIQNGRPYFHAQFFFIGMLDTGVLDELGRHVIHDRHGVALRLNRLMDESAPEQRVNDFPPGGFVVQADIFLNDERVQIRQGVRVVQVRLVLVRPLFIGKADSSAEHVRHFGGGRLGIQRSRQE